MSIRRVGAGTALMVAGAFFTSAQAAPITGGEGMKRLVDPYAMAEKAQVFVWGGRRHCFYDDAWNGPGWYWCDYAWRRGSGWGGRAGWHGWRLQSRQGASDRGPRRAGTAERRGFRDGRSGRSDATKGRAARSESGRAGRSSVNRGAGRSDGGRGVSSGRSGGGGSATSGRGGGGSATSGRGGGGGEARGGGGRGG